jgi:hypothetical protein
MGAAGGVAADADAPPANGAVGAPAAAAAPPAAAGAAAVPASAAARAFPRRGQLVAARGLGRARVLSDGPAPPGAPFVGCWLVEALDAGGRSTGRTRHVFSRALRPLREVRASTAVAAAAARGRRRSCGPQQARALPPSLPAALALAPCVTTPNPADAPQPPSRITVVETTRDYRDAACAFTHPDDVVLEVGCHIGERAGGAAAGGARG